MRFTDKALAGWRRPDPGRDGVLPVLLGRLVPGLDPLMTAARRRRLEELSTRATAWNTGTLRILAEAELAGTGSLPAVTVAAVRRAALEPHHHDALSALAERLTDPVINPGECWSDRVLAELPCLAPAFTELLAHAATATGARPTAAWDAGARALLAGLGGEAVRGRVLPWLALVGEPGGGAGPGGEPGDGLSFDAFNANALRGLVWALSLLPPHPAIPRALGALLETSLRRPPGRGPCSPKTANACVLALARIDDPGAAAELARLATRVTYRTTLGRIGEALTAKARARGVGRADVEELTLSDHGLTGEGTARIALGDCAAELRIVGGAASLTWITAASRTVKSPPAAARRDHADRIAELRARARDIGRTLSSLSARLERQILAGRSWPYRVWRERHLDHPVAGTLARRLLWVVGGTTCCWADGALRTLGGAELPPPGADREVALWHPLGADPAEVAAWRRWLEERGITQPFKQAHREVYPLTAAERATGTYSNRFAGHVLRQHRFHALAAGRGWTDRLRLRVGDAAPAPRLDLPYWGLRAEFWVTGGTIEEGGEPELTGSGAYVHLLTDQVRFYPLDAPGGPGGPGGPGAPGADGHPERPDGGPVPLESVPPLVLSEVLRDVDLFVAVASVGSDPAWSDGGPAGRYARYWHSYGFGELGVSAEARRELLAGLLPRLAVGGRCTIAGRYLNVTGVRHSYRIHLGSGNVLIAPHDRYLCIVPGAARDDSGYLPFEGDRLLSVILSKAMLLARDDEITDPAILGQL